MQQTVGKKWRNCFQYIFWLITGTQSLPLLGKTTKVMYKCVSRLKLDGKVGKKVQIILYSSNSKFVNGSSKYSILSLFGYHFIHNFFTDAFFLIFSLLCLRRWSGRILLGLLSVFWTRMSSKGIDFTRKRWLEE